MIINLKAKIEELIQAFHENGKLLNDAITAVIEEFKTDDAVKAYKPEYIAESVQKGIAAARNQHHTVDVLLNKKLVEAIEGAKKKLLPELSAAKDKPGDYEMKVANALKFLEIEGDGITDDSAFLILKDFASDYEKMKLFKKVIGKKVELIDANGDTTFPKTFGAFNHVELLVNTFDDLDKTASTMFTMEKQEGQTTIIYGENYTLLVDSYEEMTAEDESIAAASFIDDEAAKIDADVLEN